MTLWAKQSRAPRSVNITRCPGFGSQNIRKLTLFPQICIANILIMKPALLTRLVLTQYLEVFLFFLFLLRESFCHSFYPPETRADICIEQNNGFLFITQRCGVCAWMGAYCSAPLKACGSGSLLILGMLLPGEQSKWGLSEIKCHRSEGLSLWNLLQTDLFVVVTLSDASWRHAHASSPHACPARSQVLCVAPVYFLFQWEQNRLSEWLFIPLTYLECC